MEAGREGDAILWPHDTNEIRCGPLRICHHGANTDVPLGRTRIIPNSSFIL
jgi:hypothetical protein